MKRQFITALSILAVTNANALTLKEGLKIVFDENSSLQEFKKDVDIAQEKTKQAFSSFLPTAGITYSLSHTDTNRDNDADSSAKPSVAYVYATQNIFKGGSVIAGYNQAKASQKATSTNLKAQQQNIFVDSAEKYLTVLTSEEVLELSKRRVSTNAEELKRLQKRFELGDVTLPDIKEFEARYAGYVAEKEAASGKLIAANSEFLANFNRESKNLNWPKLTSQLPATVDEAISLAQANNPSINKAKLNLKAAEEKIKVERARFLPSVTATADWSNNNNMEYNDTKVTSVSLNASLPLFVGGKNVSKFSEAKITAKKANDTLKQAMRDVKAATRIAYNNVMVEKARVKALTISFNSFKITADAIRKQEEAGEASVIDVLDAEDDSFSADVDLKIARQRLILAQLELLSEIGQFTVENLDKIFKEEITK